ncbi:MAG: VanZ family protein [Shinella sp.]|nr:MAG: VanZ family protein [Shinella sp.]
MHCEKTALGYHDGMMTRRLCKTAAWLSLAFIVFATVSPIGLRPHDPLPVNLDRALAFCLMSGLFVLVYPRRWLMVLILTLVGAGAIETLQYLSPTRHAHMIDAMVKAGGAAAGVAFAVAFNRLRPRVAGRLEERR